MPLTRESGLVREGRTPARSFAQHLLLPCKHTCTLTHAWPHPCPYTLLITSRMQPMLLNLGTTRPPASTAAPPTASLTSQASLLAFPPDSETQFPRVRGPLGGSRQV